MENAEDSFAKERSNGENRQFILDFSGGIGRELVTISSLMLEFLILSVAGSVSTGWQTAAYTPLAPYSARALAPSQRDPAVSTISSTTKQFLSFTLPMMFMTLATPGSGRLFSMMAIGAPTRSASSLALVTPPRSGETMVRFSRFLDLHNLPEEMRTSDDRQEH